jgi:hypothetical protein
VRKNFGYLLYGNQLQSQNKQLTNHKAMIKPIKLIISIAVFALAIQATVSAQTNSLTDILKQHFNETVHQVKNSDDPDEKRAILTNSFSDMVKALDRIESYSDLSDDEMAQVQVLKDNIKEKVSELNGEDGYDEITDEELDDFTDYSQQDMEQASRNITISLTTALLIIIILLLL